MDLMLLLFCLDLISIYGTEPVVIIPNERPAKGEVVSTQYGHDGQVIGSFSADDGTLLCVII